MYHKVPVCIVRSSIYSNTVVAVGYISVISNVEVVRTLPDDSMRCHGRRERVGERLDANVDTLMSSACSVAPTTRQF